MFDCPFKISVFKVMSKQITTWTVNQCCLHHSARMFAPGKQHSMGEGVGCYTSQLCIPFKCSSTCQNETLESKLNLVLTSPRPAMMDRYARSLSLENINSSYCALP